MDRIVKRYHGFVRLKASSYFLVGGDWTIWSRRLSAYTRPPGLPDRPWSQLPQLPEPLHHPPAITAVKTSTATSSTAERVHLVRPNPGLAATASRRSRTSCRAHVHDPSSSHLLESCTALSAALRARLSDLETCAVACDLDGRSYEEIAGA